MHTEDCTEDLKPYRILKDHADLQAIVGGITDCLNPQSHKITLILPACHLEEHMHVLNMSRMVC